MLAKLPKPTKENPNVIWNAIANEEWNRWRLVMAEDCSITKTEAFGMDDIDVAVANAALNRAMKEKKKASNGKKGG